MNNINDNYFEIFQVESGGDDLAVVGPLLALEAEESVAFELLDERMSVGFLVQLRFRCEDFSDQMRIRNC